MPRAPSNGHVDDKQEMPDSSWVESKYIYDDKHCFVFDKRGSFYDLQRDLSQVDCLDDSILLAIQVSYSWVASIIHEETSKKGQELPPGFV